MNEPSLINKMIFSIGGMALSRVAIVAAILTGIYYAVIYDNGDTVLTAIETAKSQLEVENTKKIETQKVLKKEQQMKADVELFAKKFEEIKSRIPLEFLESDLRMTIDTYASRNNLKTTRSDRKQIMPRPNSRAEENLIEQVGLSYEFEGSYGNISKFVTEISALEKLIKIGDFSLNTALARMNQKGKTKDLIFKVDIIGFKQSFESLKSSAKKVTQ